MPPAEEGRNFQFWTARTADCSKSVYPKDLLTDTEVGSPESLTETMSRTTP